MSARHLGSRFCDAVCLAAAAWTICCHAVVAARGSLRDLLIVAGAAAAASPSAREVVEKAKEATKLDGAEMVATLTIMNAKKQKRVRTIATVSKLYDGGEEKKLVAYAIRRK